MTDAHDISEEEEFWLVRLIRRQPKSAPLQLRIPSEIQAALLERGFIQLKRRQVELTLDGILAIGRRRPHGEERG